MKVATGQSILDRIACGRLLFLQRHEEELAQHSQLSVQEELSRFQTAQRQAVLQLAAYYDQAFRQVGEETAAIFAIHAMLLEDEDFVQAVHQLIQTEHVTAQFAVQTAGNRIAGAFSLMDSPYMQARAMDIRDISRRVTNLLLGVGWHDPFQGQPAILVSNAFMPSEVMQLPHRLLLGIVSLHGSVDSHTAMLLRAYQIPALAQVELEHSWDGHDALLDGFQGRLYLDPEPGLADRLQQLYRGDCPAGIG